MPIQLLCAECGARFSVADDLVGRRTRCPRCSNPVTVAASGGAARAEVTDVEPIDEEDDGEYVESQSENRRPRPRAKRRNVARTTFLIGVVIAVAVVLFAATIIGTMWFARVLNKGETIRQGIERNYADPRQ